MLYIFSSVSIQVPVFLITTNNKITFFFVKSNIYSILRYFLTLQKSNYQVQSTYWFSFPIIFVEPHALKNAFMVFKAWNLILKNYLYGERLLFFFLNKDVDIEIWNSWQRINLKKCHQWDQ
jgi:hypothetical protein